MHITDKPIIVFVGILRKPDRIGIITDANVPAIIEFIGVSLCVILNYILLFIANNDAQTAKATPVDGA